MHTVKRFNRGDTIRTFQLTHGTAYRIAKSTVYGVIGPNGLVVMTKNKATGKLQEEIYDRKATAQAVANWYNQK